MTAEHLLVREEVRQSWYKHWGQPEARTLAHACLGGSSCKAGRSLAASIDCWNSFWAESISAWIVRISGSTELRTSATACLNVRNASPSPSPKLCISPGEMPAGCAAFAFIAICCACTRATASLLTIADGRLAIGFAWAPAGRGGYCARIIGAGAAARSSIVGGCWPCPIDWLEADWAVIGRAACGWAAMLYITAAVVPGVSSGPGV